WRSAFAIPGAPTGMELLKDILQPPLVVFRNRTWNVWQTFANNYAMRAVGSAIAAEASLHYRELQEKLDREAALAALTGPSPPCRTQALRRRPQENRGSTEEALGGVQ